MKPKSRYRIPKIPKRFFLSLVHGFFLLLVGYVWLGMTYTFGDEAFLIKWTSLIKKEILAIDPKPDPGSVLFVNTSATKVQVYTDADPLSLKPSTELITDRVKLAQLLELMVPYKDSIRLIVVDVLFDIAAEGDSLLQKQFDRLGDKVLCVSYMPSADSLIRPVFSVPYALATYRSAAGMYFKYPVITGELKTLPTVMYEKLNGREFSGKGLLYRVDGKLSFKAPITDFKVRMSDFRVGSDLHQANFALHHLETVNLMGPLMDKSDLNKLFSNKLIMIGDFSTDIHKTPFGVMPGMLVIYNAYLTLQDDENIMNLFWLLLMLAGFTWISYRLISGKGFNLFDLLKKKYKSGWVHFIIDSVDEIFFLSLLTLLSYFFFNIHINILVLFIYLKIMEFFIEYLRHKFKLSI